MATEIDTGGVVEVRADRADQAAAETPARSPRLLAVLGFAVAAGGLCVLALMHFGKPSAAPSAFQDLGAGISNATGLRGSLKARWQGASAQYQLELEPIDPLQSAGFSFVAAHPPGPLFLHMRLLDATGYQVCGKDVLFPLDPSSPGEADRERGHDVLQAAVDDNGKVVSMSAQGTLPCTPQQYKQVDYWDFSTNFPALADQDRLMAQSSDARSRQDAKAHARRKAQPSAFYLEGDERATGYDASRNLLESGMGRNYRVTGAGQQATAASWADHNALLHYKCDQSSHCELVSAGQSLSVTALQ